MSASGIRALKASAPALQTASRIVVCPAAMALPCRRVRDQPPQATPGGGHPLRQTRRPIRGHHPDRSHQRLAM